MQPRLRLGIVRAAVTLVLLAGVAKADWQAKGCKFYSGPGPVGPQAGPVLSTIPVPDNFPVEAVGIQGLNIQHARIGALKITLSAAADATSPIKTVIVKDVRTGGAAANMVNATFDEASSTPFPGADAAPFTGIFLPQELFQSLTIGDGSAAGNGGSKGAWTLRVIDLGTSAESRQITLQGWNLVLCPPATVQAQSRSDDIAALPTAPVMDPAADAPDTSAQPAGGAAEPAPVTGGAPADATTIITPTAPAVNTPVAAGAPVAPATAASSTGTNSTGPLMTVLERLNRLAEDRTPVFGSDSDGLLGLRNITSGLGSNLLGGRNTTNGGLLSGGLSTWTNSNETMYERLLDRVDDLIEPFNSQRGALGARDNTLASGLGLRNNTLAASLGSNLGGAMTGGLGSRLGLQGPNRSSTTGTASTTANSTMFRSAIPASSTNRSTTLGPIGRITDNIRNMVNQTALGARLQQSSGPSLRDNTLGNYLSEQTALMQENMKKTLAMVGLDGSRLAKLTEAIQGASARMNPGLRTALDSASSAWNIGQSVADSSQENRQALVTGWSDLVTTTVNNQVQNYREAVEAGRNVTQQVIQGYTNRMTAQAKSIQDQAKDLMDQVSKARDGIMDGRLRDSLNGQLAKIFNSAGGIGNLSSNLRQDMGSVTSALYDAYTSQVQSAADLITNTTSTVVGEAQQRADQAVDSLILMLDNLNGSLDKYLESAGPLADRQLNTYKQGLTYLKTSLNQLNTRLQTPTEGFLSRPGLNSTAANGTATAGAGVSSGWLQGSSFPELLSRSSQFNSLYDRIFGSQ